MPPAPRSRMRTPRSGTSSPTSRSWSPPAACASRSPRTSALLMLGHLASARSCRSQCVCAVWHVVRAVCHVPLPCAVCHVVWGLQSAPEAMVCEGGREGGRGWGGGDGFGCSGRMTRKDHPPTHPPPPISTHMLNVVGSVAEPGMAKKMTFFKKSEVRVDAWNISAHARTQGRKGNICT